MGLRIQINRYYLKLLLFGLFSFIANPANADVVDLFASDDTYVDSKRSTSQYGSNSYIRLKESSRSDRHGLINFDTDDIPNGANIESAKLSLYITYRGSSSYELSVYEALDSWSESTTWSSKPSRLNLAEDSISVDRSGDFYELDVTALVQDWVDGVVDNNGLYLLVNKGQIYIKSSESSSKNPILSISYNVQDPDPDPVPDPDPDPEPNPGGITDTGVSDAPLLPANKRVVVVSKDGTGDYGSISAAVDHSLPGDTIQVKNGVYVERVEFERNGTRDLPIALINYPGHSPVIDPGGGDYPEECCPSGGTPRVEINAEWIIVEGFEIRYGWDGVKIYNPHNTVRNNWIHHNKKQGILVVSTDDIYIAGNSINNNGTEDGTCIIDGEFSPKHCHAIYLSDYSCEGMDDITVRGNTLSNHAGGGVHWNGLDCGSTKMSNNLLENNIIENNSFGMVLYHNVDGAIIRNNTFVLEDYPNTNDTSHAFIAIWNSTGNLVANNIFYSTKDDVSGVQIRDAAGTQNTFDQNLWSVEYNWWVWQGSWRSDFEDYQSVSGWGSNALFGQDPGFINVNDVNYHISNGSDAKDSGDNLLCSLFDIDSEDRSDQHCDIGADEKL